MNRYIQRMIREQFNIGNMDLNNNKQKHNANIFNKALNHPYYYNVLDGTATESEIKELNSLVGVAAPKDKNELRKIIEFYSENYPEDSLNWLDVSEITDMNNLFKNTLYNGDISKWNTSNVTDMSYMFSCAYKFNKSIGNWDVSHVSYMDNMFYCAKRFNKPIGSWDVSHVRDMKYMFGAALKFNQDINDWDVSNVLDMSYMFHDAENFNQPIGRWDVSNVLNMHAMFNIASYFNQPIGGWNVSHVRDMGYMFYYAELFNQDISEWNIKDNIIINNIFDHCPIKKGYKPIKLR